jgi:hypothetical protein
MIANPPPENLRPPCEEDNAIALKEYN